MTSLVALDFDATPTAPPVGRERTSSTYRKDKDDDRLSAEVEHLRRVHERRPEGVLCQACDFRLLFAQDLPVLADAA